MNSLGNIQTTDKMIFMHSYTDDNFTISMDDIAEIMVYHNRENANVPHTPESTNLAIAARLKKEYALRKIFSKSVSDAHISGNIHVHDLDMPDRPYCGGHSPAYVAKYGLSLPNQNAIAKPAKHPEVLLEQLIKFAAGMQGHYSGAVGYDAFNMFLAPYLVGLSEERIKQLAQIIVFEFSQQAVARGGQVIFSDLNLYWGVPKHYADINAVGPGGVDTGIPYKEYDNETKLFMKALMEVYLEGDGSGRPFFFPKPDCHITAESVNDDEYLNLLGKVASVRGSPYFVFDRGTDPSISQCCRLKVSLTKEEMVELKEPWKVRFSALQNVSMNLPGMAYQCKNDEGKFYELLAESMVLAGIAHQEKFHFIDTLMDMGNTGPLAMLNMTFDGHPYLRYDRIKFLIGMVGLNEAVQILTGQEMHESKDAYMKGMKIISFMNQECKKVAKDIGFVTVLEQTPAESTAYRFAKLDLSRFGASIKPYLRGNPESGEVYYTNSTQLNTSSNISAIERVKMEGKFHPMIDAGAITHVWLGEHIPPAEGIAAFVRKTYENTQNSQIAFSPEFTTCYTCNRTVRGLHENCPLCGSEHVDGITRVTGFFSRISGWNIGKRAELRDRAKTAL